MRVVSSEAIWRRGWAERWRSVSDLLRVCGVGIVSVLIGISCASGKVPAGTTERPPSATAQTRPTPSSVGVDRCRGSVLKLRDVGRVAAGAGSATVGFDIVNRSGVGCWLQGVPEVQLVNANGKTLPIQEVVDNSVPDDRVMIAPGKGAPFWVSVGGMFPDEEHNCPVSAGVIVMAPGTIEGLRKMGVVVRPCGSVVRVRALSASGSKYP